MSGSAKLNPKNRRVWVVRATWKENTCPNCKSDLIETLKSESLNIPDEELFVGTVFLAPYQFLHLKCLHEGSSHINTPCIESVYGKA